MEITVEVQDITGQYILRQYINIIGDGKRNSHLIVEIDGRVFTVASSDIAKAVIEKVKEEHS